MASTPTPESLLELAANPPSDPTARKALHDAARQAMLGLEDFGDTDSRLMTGFILYPMTVTAFKLNIFSTLAESPQKSWHVNDLATRRKPAPCSSTAFCATLQPRSW